MSPAMTTLLSEWPLGKEGEDSNGGDGVRLRRPARPTRTLPTVVIDSDPATAITISTSGVRDRHSEGHGHGDDGGEDGHPDRAAEVGEPRGDLVARAGSGGVIAASSAGRSSPVTPSPSSTAS